MVVRFKCHYPAISSHSSVLHKVFRKADRHAPRNGSGTFPFNTDRSPLHFTVRMA